MSVWYVQVDKRERGVHELSGQCELVDRQHECHGMLLQSRIFRARRWPVRRVCGWEVQERVGSCSVRGVSREHVCGERGVGLHRVSGGVHVAARDDEGGGLLQTEQCTGDFTDMSRHKLGQIVWQFRRRGLSDIGLLCIWSDIRSRKRKQRGYEWGFYNGMLWKCE